MHPLIASKKKEIAEICRRFGVKRLEVFGSAARGADFDPEKSDADFLVEFSAISSADPLGEFFGLKDALSAALGRPVDLVQIVAVSNPYILKTINEDREPLYAA